jgi:hypothetical protein
MRKGWLKRRDDERPPEKPPVYLLWQDDGMAADHTQAGEPPLTVVLPIGVRFRCTPNTRVRLSI